ncbi:hypothetical protein ID866_1434 [Astraeus odoratus]|nr:hypothetical protein ID866_1434 [Astraeus odoratus]
MLLCRRILRVHVQNPVSIFRLPQSPLHGGALAISRFTVRTTRNVFSHGHHYHNTHTTSPRGLVAQANTPPLHTNFSHPNSALLATVLRISRHSEPTKCVKECKIVAGKKVVEEGEYSPFQAYMLLRSQDPAFAASLPTEVLCRIAQGAVKYGCQDIVDSITADILDGEEGDTNATDTSKTCSTNTSSIGIAPETVSRKPTDRTKDHDTTEGSNKVGVTGFPLQDRARIAAALLCVSPRHSHLLVKRKVHSLLTLINLAGQISSLPVLAACYVMRAVFEDPRPDPCDGEVIMLALPRFLRWLGSWYAPTDARAVSYKPSETILAAYGIVNRLIVLEEREMAFQLFRVLTENHHIPAEVFRHVNSAVEAGSNGKDNSTTTCSFNMIIRNVLARASVHWGWYHLAVELMSVTIEAQGRDKDQNVTEREMFDMLHTAIESSTPDQLRYCAVLMCSLARGAQRIVIPEHTVGLFYYRARLLRDGLSAEMFYSCTQSFKVLRRVRYPSPRGMTFVWLMNYLAEERHNMHLARALAKQLVEYPVPIPPNERAALVSMVAKSGFAESARALWERYDVGQDRELVVGNAATMVRMVSLFASLISKTRRKVAMLKGAMDADLQTEAIEETETKLADLSRFTRRVLVEFHKLKQPLDKATHHDLNALARGYFLLGGVKQGLLPYRALLRRKEIPDLYDINVALSAVSQHSPRMAAAIVARMIEMGLQPDVVTFDTVMHQALAHGDLELASGLVKQANEHGLEDLSTMSMVALIRASIDDRVITLETLKTNLSYIWEIVQATPRTSMVHTPNLGKRCIRASVQTGDPEMAFGFWNLLVRWKTEWGDREQVQLRRAIGGLVRRCVGEGKLEVERGREMLHALGLGGGTDGLFGC